MSLGKVLARGQITVPKGIRRAADIRPGDTIYFKVVGPGRVELHTLPRMTLEETFERYRIDEPVDWEHYKQEAEDAAAQEFVEHFNGRFNS